MTKHLVVADGDEHLVDGHLTEDLKVRNLMVEKRLRKEQGIMAEVVPPEFQGDESPDLLLITWAPQRVGKIPGRSPGRELCRPRRRPRRPWRKG